MEKVESKSNVYEIIEGDCIEVLQRLEKEGRKYDALVADPPYCSGAMQPAQISSKGVRKYVEKEYKATFWDGMSQRSFTLYASEWLRLAKRCLKDTAYFFIFIDWRQYPAMSDAVQFAGLSWRGTAVWNKKNSRPNIGHISQTAEFILWGTVGTKSDKIVPDGVIEESSPAICKRYHPTEKSVKVVKELLKILPDDAQSVLDPFSGSATTGAAALSLGLDYTGIEKEKYFCDVSRERLELLQEELKRKTTRPLLAIERKQRQRLLFSEKVLPAGVNG